MLTWYTMRHKFSHKRNRFNIKILQHNIINIKASYSLKPNYANVYVVIKNNM